MARRHYQKHKLKIKLKKNTVYTIVAFLVILSGLLLGLSYTRNGSSFTSLNDYVIGYFGMLGLLLPVLLILFGFFFLKLKMFLSKPNVAIGFLVFFVSLLGLSKAGSTGLYLNQLLSDIITGTGSFLVYLAGVFVGLVVFFDTSVDELMAILGSILVVVEKLIPSKGLSFFKKKSSGLDKQMVIKGMNKNEVPIP